MWFVTIHPFDDGTAELRGPLPIWYWLDQREVRSASTACRRKSGRNETSITKNWKRYRKGILISRNGCAGIWTAWIALSKESRKSWPTSSKKHASGSFRNVTFNNRQKDILMRLLEGFEGNLTTSKYAKIEKCLRIRLCATSKSFLSWASATRYRGGRSTSYSLLGPPETRSVDRARNTLKRGHCKHFPTEAGDMFFQFFGSRPTAWQPIS